MISHNSRIALQFLDPQQSFLFFLWTLLALRFNPLQPTDLVEIAVEAAN